MGKLFNKSSNSNNNPPPPPGGGGGGAGAVADSARAGAGAGAKAAGTGGAILAHAAPIQSESASQARIGGKASPRMTLLDHVKQQETVPAPKVKTVLDYAHLVNKK